MKQELTAVEWLVEYFSKYVDMNKHLEEIEQAKEIEKKQITNSKGISLTNMFIKAFKRIFWGVKANTHKKSV